jgi:hypothetical protein
MMTPAAPAARSLRQRLTCAASLKFSHLVWVHGAPFVAALMLGAVAFVAADRAPPLKILGADVEPPAVPAGTDATIHWNITWHRLDCLATLSPELVTEHEIVWKFDTHRLHAPQNGDGLERSFRVPWTIPPGTVRYRATVEFRCNWLQGLFPIVVKTPEIPFKVTAAPK